MAGTPGTTAGPTVAIPGAGRALALLMVINLFNYVDRQVLSAVLPRMQRDPSILALDDAYAQTKMGLLTSAFMASYMLLSLAAGWLDGRGARRWVVMGFGVVAWSIASGCSGFAAGYWTLLLTRCLVGVGEAAYGPIASSMLADLYPASKRGKVIAIFNMAIPVGSALGFVIGGVVADLAGDWRPAFYITFSGLLVGVWCFGMPEYPRPLPSATDPGPKYADVLKSLARNRSFVLCCLGMTAIVFVSGGVAAWVPAYVIQRESRFRLTPEVLDRLAALPEEKRVPEEVLAKVRPLADGSERTLVEFKAALAPPRLTDAEALVFANGIFDAATVPGSPTLTGVNLMFGGILIVGGFGATALGAWAAERLKPRLPGAYFWASAAGAFFALPCYLALLYVPFPAAWAFVFLAIFGLFTYTGPAFTAIANVTKSHERATAFAVNILVIHLFGDAVSPTIIGAVADATSLQTAFLLMSALILLGGVLWAAGAKYLEADTRRAA